jgi:hypothetical protein
MKNKLKNIVALQLMLFALLQSCNNRAAQDKVMANVESEETNKTEEYGSFYYLEKLVLSSKFPFPDDIPQEKIHVLYDSDENYIYLCRVYFDTDGTGTLGWVKYDVKCENLYDITGNEGTMNVLAFDKKWSDEFRKSLKEDIPVCKEDDINNSIVYENNCIRKTSKSLPYSEKIDIDKVKYEKMDCAIDGIDEFSCGDNTIRYIPLPSKGDVDILLIPLDCGDFPYRYFLITIKEYKLISDLYVEGECIASDSSTSQIEQKMFMIDTNYHIEVTTIVGNKTVKTEYNIQDDGKIVKIE